MCYNKHIGTTNENNVNIKRLATEFGLPCIERGNSLFVVGEKEIIEFNQRGEVEMATKENLVTSPIGEIQFMAAGTPVKSTNDKLVYTIRLAYDSKKDAKWLAQIADINDAKVVTATSYRGKSAAVKALLATGKSLVSANSNFKPAIYDKDGNELEEAPMFFSDSTGTAQMIVSPYKGEKGGTINLVGIILHSVSSAEGTTDGADRETRLSQLRAAVEAATKG